MKVRPSGPGRRALPAAGLIALAVFFVPRIPTALALSVERLRAASVARKEGAEAALARLRGKEYAAAIAWIRESIPADGVYLLFAETDGADMIVRYELAPRRAVFGGLRRDAPAFLSTEALARLPRWAVIADFDDPWPRLVATRDLAAPGARP
jgi:hypothetical protein